MEVEECKEEEEEEIHLQVPVDDVRVRQALHAQQDLVEHEADVRGGEELRRLQQLHQVRVYVLEDKKEVAELLHEGRAAGSTAAGAAGAARSAAAAADADASGAGASWGGGRSGALAARPLTRRRARRLPRARPWTGRLGRRGLETRADDVEQGAHVGVPQVTKDPDFSVDAARVGCPAAGKDVAHTFNGHALVAVAGSGGWGWETAYCQRMSRGRGKWEEVRGQRTHLESMAS